MRLNVNLKFKDAERVEIVKFAKEIGMNVDEFCKRAVFYAINDAYRRAEEAVANDPNVLNSTSSDSSGNTGNKLSGGSSDSPTLSDAGNAITDSQA